MPEVRESVRDLGLSDDTSLGAAKAALSAALDSADRIEVSCPCCNRINAKRLRNFDARMAGAVTRLYGWDRSHPGEWCHAPSYFSGTSIGGGGDWTKAERWDLIEQCQDRDQSGTTKMTGLWRITERGRLFVRGRISIPSYLVETNQGETTGWSQTPIMINQVRRFDYSQVVDHLDSFDVLYDYGDDVDLAAEE